MLWMAPQPTLRIVATGRSATQRLASTRRCPPVSVTHALGFADRLNGGSVVADGRDRHLDQQARRLGFANVCGCLHALLDDGWSIPRSPPTSTPPKRPSAAPSPTTRAPRHTFRNGPVQA